MWSIVLYWQLLLVLHTGILAFLELHGNLCAFVHAIPSAQKLFQVLSMWEVPTPFDLVSFLGNDLYIVLSPGRPDI